MKIELRNVKHAAFASEETDCFTATVYLDGKRVGEVSNAGKGGCNEYHPHELEKRLNEYAKTLPQTDIGCDVGGSGSPVMIEQDADTVIGTLLHDWMLRRDLTRALSRKVLFTRPGQTSVYETKALKKETIAHAIGPNHARTLEQFKADRILNCLPFDEALTIYRSATA